MFYIRLRLIIPSYPPYFPCLRALFPLPTRIFPWLPAVFPLPTRLISLPTRHISPGYPPYFPVNPPYFPCLSAYFLCFPSYFPCLRALFSLPTWRGCPPCCCRWCWRGTGRSQRTAAPSTTCRRQASGRDKALTKFWVLQGSVVDPDPVVSVSFGRIRIHYIKP